MLPFNMHPFESPLIDYDYGFTDLLNIKSY